MRNWKWRASSFPPFDRAAFLNGSMTPIWFGSAINSFGVKELMDGIGEYGPEPQPQKAAERQVSAEETPSQASSSRSRPTWTRNTATGGFVRLASGHFERGMKLTTSARKSDVDHEPVLFLAADREIAKGEAWAGDIIGIPNHGQLRIGDALTEGESLRFTGIPPSHPNSPIHPRAGPMKAKHLEKALTQFARRVPPRFFKPMIGSGYIVGVVGRAAVRRAGQPDRAGIQPSRPLRRVELHLRPLDFGDKAEIEKLVNVNKGHIALDSDGDLVFLTRLQWDIDRVVRDYRALS